MAEQGETETRTHWVIDLDGFDDNTKNYTSVLSDRVRFDGGIVIFEDGDVFNSTLVLAMRMPKNAIIIPFKPDTGDGCICDDD